MTLQCIEFLQGFCGIHGSLGYLDILSPVALSWRIDVTNLLANDGTVYKWSLCWQWRKGLRRHWKDIIHCSRIPHWNVIKCFCSLHNDIQSSTKHNTKVHFRCVPLRMEHYIYISLYVYCWLHFKCAICHDEVREIYLLYLYSLSGKTSHQHCQFSPHYNGTLHCTSPLFPLWAYVYQCFSDLW